MMGSGAQRPFLSGNESTVKRRERAAHGRVKAKPMLTSLKEMGNSAIIR